MLRRLLSRTILLAGLLLVPARAEAAAYTVQPGDTLSTIAARQNVSLADLARANGLANLNFIRVGQVLVIPGSPTAPAASTGIFAAGTFWYRAQPGDSMYGLATRFGITFATIHALNPSMGAYPLLGEWLKLCWGCSAASPISTSPSAPAARSAAGNVYIVQPGDTLISVALRFGVSLAALLAANNLIDANLIVSGTRLSIPAASAASPAVPAPETSSLIASYADLYGVPRALALAVSWQESGFNQGEVSATGAIGAMQVEPYTADVISRLLGKPLNLYALNDNIQAGVFWLSRLLAYYGGNRESAIAAYYQGIKSIQRHGLFTDTVQYVRNVEALEARFAGGGQ